MPSTIKDEVRRNFELAALRKEAQHLRTSRQWSQADDVRVWCADIRTRLNERFDRQYQTRVEVARRRIIDEAGKPHREPRPLGLGADRFSLEDTLRQAHREVRHAHQRQLDRIDEFETKELRRLTEEFRRENDMQGQARDVFTQAADRRAIPDLRVEFERHRSVQRIE